LKRNGINRTFLNTFLTISERANYNNTHFGHLSPYPRNPSHANLSHCEVPTARISQLNLPCSELLASNCSADHNSPCPHGRNQNRTRLSLSVGSNKTILEQKNLKGRKNIDRDIKHLRGMHNSSTVNWDRLDNLKAPSWDSL
jgi:hypothetical protein